MALVVLKVARQTIGVVNKDNRDDNDDKDQCGNNGQQNGPYSECSAC